MDITSTTDVDYYKFVVPSGMGGSLTVTVQSTGLSQLSPSLATYASNQTQIGTTVSSTSYGATLTTTLTVTAGQTYYVKVAGMTTNGPFATGKYALTLAFSGVASPVVSLPITTTLNAPLGRGRRRAGEPLARPHRSSQATTISSRPAAGALPVPEVWPPSSRVARSSARSTANAADRASSHLADHLDAAANDLGHLTPFLLAAGNFATPFAATSTQFSSAEGNLGQGGSDAEFSEKPTRN